MNQMQPYGDVHQPHMSAAAAHAPSTGPPSGMPHYPQYPSSMMHPGQQSYTSAQSSYPQYAGYSSVPQASPTGHPASSSLNSSLTHQSLPLPAMNSGPGASAMQQPQYNQQHTFDTTGQIAPPGMKPRVTATLWEDEGSLCFQVEAKGVCVARREDNHMINGTKLLNVAGMTRGRRDGILKSEKTRHVVKIGPMHLKGVWIPFERALDFANKEKITEQLYPLFVHDIGALLYHPSNQNRAGAAMNAVDRRRADQRYIGAAQTSQAPPLQQHHSMSNPVGSQISQPQHSIAPHPNSAGRPGLDRAHTFPTPPTSASSLIGMSGQGGSYAEWGSTGVANMQGNQQLSIDTGLSNARSVPTTPASTPPGTLQSMQPYQTSQAYDGSRQMYTAPAPQSAQYGSQSQSMMRYGAPLQTPTYGKTDMAPPSRGGDSEHPIEPKQEQYGGQGGEHVAHGHAGVEEQEHENDNEYTHSSAGYGANRAPYSYNPQAAPPALHSGDHNLSPEMTGSPSHQNGSGRATPRTATAPPAQWPSGYGSAQRGPQSASNSLYNVVSDSRPNGAVGADGYSASGPVQAAYPSQSYGAVNGANPSLKRMRDLSDDESDPYGRPSSRGAGDDVDGLKRRKTIHEGQMGGAVGPNTYDGGSAGNMQRARNPITQRRK